MHCRRVLPLSAAAVAAVLLVVAATALPGAQAAGLATPPRDYAGAASDSVLLSEVKAVTLYRDRMTAGRRLAPEPQLRCVGGAAQGAAAIPDVVQCRAMGSDGVSLQWKCEAQLPAAMRFGRTDVVCEGYSGPGDERILRGSCGLEYTLEYTDPSASSWSSSSWSSSSSSSSSSQTSTDKQSMTATGFLVVLTAALVIAAIFLLWAPPHSPSATTPAAGRPGGYGGYGGGYPTPSAPPAPTFGCGPTAMPTATAGSSGPGFWTGLGLGAAGGYMAGRRSSARSGWASPSYSSSSSRPSYSSSSSSSSSSSGTRKSTGYGGTISR